MPEINCKFSTPEPVRFKESGSDTEFAATISGILYLNNFDEAAYGATEEEQKANLQKWIAGKIGEHLAVWNENGLLLRPSGQEALEGMLGKDISDAGMEGSVRIHNVRMDPEMKKLYDETFGEPEITNLFPQIKAPEDAKDDPHGPLIKFSIDYFSHGMMAGTSSGSSTGIEWKSDGSIILTDSSSGSGMSVNNKYSIKPEEAQKIRDYVSSKHLAALSKMDIETPVMFDNFTSSSISMVFDDSSLGGSRYEMCTINCGPAGFSFKTIEDEINALFKECSNTGEFLLNESKEPDGFNGFLGMLNMNQQMTSGGTENASTAPSGTSEEKWICSCGYGNTRKFCENCGNPKTVSEEAGTWVCPACKTSGNRGSFCAECGSRRPE